MLVILHWGNLCLFFCHTNYTKSVQTAPTVLCWDPMACGHHFLFKSTHLYKKWTAVTDVFLRSSFFFFYCCSVQFRIALCCKEKLWKEDLAQRSPLSLTRFMHNSSINTCPDHISTGFLSPYYFLHPLTELLRLFKWMTKSFYDTLGNQLLKGGSESSSQLPCAHFEHTK